MRIAAYQGPYLPFGSFDSVKLVAEAVSEAEAAEVDILCCPEAFLGGLAHESEGEDPWQVALTRDALDEVAQSFRPERLTTIVGFTERADDRVYNSAAIVDPSGGS